MLAQPDSDLLTHVPRGVIPNQHQYAFALRLGPLAEPLQKIGRHLTELAPFL